MTTRTLRASLSTLALLVLALQAAPEPAWAQRSAPRQLNAWQLIAACRSAVADLGRGLSDPKGGFDPRRADHVAFRTSLARMEAQLGTVDARFRARDRQVFAELEAGSRALGELRVRWARAGLANSAASASLRSLSVAYRRLRAVYGREGLRFRQGPPLTEAEERHFERLQQGTRVFVARLHSLRQRAAGRGDRSGVAEIDRLLSEADRIAQADPDLASYLNTTMANDEMAGEWTAQADDLRRLDPGGWGDADEAVAQLYVESDIGHVFQLDLGNTQDWDYLDQPTEVDLDGPGERPRMQVFHLAGKGPDGTALFESGAATPGVEGAGNAEALDAPETREGMAEEASAAGEQEAPADVPRSAAAQEPLSPALAWELFRALLRLWLRSF